jgi:hypothetical protein
VPEFSSPELVVQRQLDALDARLLSRTVLGKVVIDHEVVTRTFPEGLGQLELVCIYLIDQGKIQSASFSFGPSVLSKLNS